MGTSIHHHSSALGWLWVLLFATFDITALVCAIIAIAGRRRRTALTALVVSGAASIACLVAMGAATTVGITSAYATTDSTVDPSQKARVLAEGISVAMNGAALGLISTFIAVVGLVASLVAFLVYRSRPEPPPDQLASARRD